MWVHKLCVSILFFSIIVLAVLEASCLGADWKYFGATILSEGKAIAFYDAEGAEQLANRNVKVWTKAFTDQAEFTRRANRKTNINSAAKKLSENYIPPFCLVDSKNCEKLETAVNVISWEVTASDEYLTPNSRILFEIDCGQNMIRTLSVMQYKKNSGLVHSWSGSDKWEYISPETNAETLRKIVCTPIR